MKVTDSRAPKALLISALAALILGAAAVDAVRHAPPAPIRAAMQTVIPNPQRLFHKSSIRILVAGLDYDYDAKDEETSAHSRSDVIMAVKLDFANTRVSELSVPRDMVATLPGGRSAKINQAQSEGGIAETQAVVAQWLGITGFDRYVVLRIDTMKDLINAIGGIDIAVTVPMDYDDSWGHLHVHLRKGMQHLDGEEAVGYARFRHDACGDPCRIRREQELLRAIVTRLRTDRLNTAVHIGQLLEVIDKDVETNLTFQEQLGIAFAMRNLAPARIVTAQVPYKAEVDLAGYGRSIVADETAKQQLVRRLLIDSDEASAGGTR
jgi:LCP family protein required for cell wall assembly